MMSRRKHLLAALALSLSVAPACDEAIEGDFGDDFDEIAFRPGGFGKTSGVLFNTNAIGDHPFSELHRLGGIHEQTQLKEVRIRIWYKEQWMLFPLDEVWAEKGELVGRRGKVIYRGNQFYGSQWYINTFSGGYVEREMYVTGYKFDNAAQLHKYEFSYPNNIKYGQHYYRKLLDQGQPNPKEGKFIGACVDENGSMDAVVYENLHVDMETGDVSTQKDILNFACLSGAVGKAATFGYPFYHVGEEIFETGLRMIRADYLGDGNSWTKAGTPIDLYDVKGINDFFDPTSKDEAIWTRGGAACINLPRRAEFTQADVMAEGVPPCKDAKITDFPDALMWTKVPI